MGLEILAPSFYLKMIVIKFPQYTESAGLYLSHTDYNALNGQSSGVITRTKNDPNIVMSSKRGLCICGWQEC